MKRTIALIVVFLLIAANLFAADGDLIVNGKVGVGTSTPAQKLSVAGTIESTTGGIKFPDGTTQASNNKPCFRAQGGVQSIPTNTVTKATWSGKAFDTNNNFDITNNWFQPTIAGYYLLTATLAIQIPANNIYMSLDIRKNEGGYEQRVIMPSHDGTVDGAYPAMTVSAVVYANGTSDYFWIAVYHTRGSSANTTGSGFDKNFSGCKLD